MNLQAKPPPHKKRKKKTAKNLSPSPTPPSFSLLPDEIIENCLARVPRSYYPKLSLVSKSFRSILSSTDIYAARSRLGRTQQCLYVCLEGLDSNRNVYFFRWITIWINPDKTKKNIVGKLSLLNPSSNCGTMEKPTIVGFEIYVIGGYEAPSSTVRVLDCRSHIWRDAPSMNVSRLNPKSCAYNEKIYVIGGINKDLFGGESWGEVFDIKTQTWERLPQPGFEIPKCYVYRITELEGKICFRSNNGYTTFFANYDPKQCRWETMSATSLWPECVIDNVSYSFEKHDGRLNLWWRDLKGGDSSKVVKGLYEQLQRHSKSLCTMTKVGSFGGKLLAIWEEDLINDPTRNWRKIWCAEIAVEKRDGGEIWGNVEWIDVVHNNYETCHFLHFLAVSL